MSSIDLYSGKPIQPRRVVITGVGAVSPVGIGADRLFEAAVAGECGIKSIDDEVSQAVNVHVAGTVDGFDGTEFGLTKKQARRWERFVQFAVVAADEAMRQAGFAQEADADGEANADAAPDANAGDTTDSANADNSATNNNKPTESGFILPADVDGTRFAVVFGSGIGGMEIFTTEAVKLHEKGAKRVNPLFIPTMISNIAAGELAIRYGLRGECSNSVVACTTGTQCIGEAYRLIKYGIADYALAGGAEESVCDISIAGFANLGALSHSDDPAHASRPFDINRDGFIAGEGAGAVVLESLESALARNANIIAEVVGFGTSCDAYHITSPDPSGDGVVRAMQNALDEAGADASDIGHLNAHGTSTAINDRTEAQAFCTLQGVEFSDTPVTSTKGMTGHMLGAAGAIEAIVTALSVASDLVPPTVGFSEADPECPVTVYTEARRDYPQKLAISNSIGFGGHNATLAIAPYSGN